MVTLAIPYRESLSLVCFGPRGRTSRLAQNAKKLCLHSENS